MIVLALEYDCIIENPTPNNRSNDSEKLLDTAKPISAAPNVNEVIFIILPRPTIVRLTAKVTALINAPIPAAAVRKPRVFGPPCRMALANTGRSTEYGAPAKLSTETRVRIER